MKSTIFYECNCLSHVLGLTKYDDEEFIYIDKYQTPYNNFTFFQRVKLSIMFILKPEKFDIHGDIILNKEVAKKLGRDLIKLTRDKKSDKIYGK